MTTPPRTAELLLAALGARAEFRDAILGDLAEEFARRAGRDGLAPARRWYYRESFRSAPHLVRDWWRASGARGVTHLAGVVLTSYVFAATIGLFVLAAVRSVAVALGAPQSFPLVAPDQPLIAALWLIPGFAGTVIGGYIAAWLGHRTAMLSALALGIVWACLAVTAGVVGSAIAPTPTWYQLAVPVLVLLGTTTGGVLRVRRRRAGP